MKFIARKHRRCAGSTVATLVLAAVLAPAAQARNVRLMESVPTPFASRAPTRSSATSTCASAATPRAAPHIVRRDVVVKGVGKTKLHDVGDDNRVRPGDHELCARAFEDAMTQLAFAARGVRATAIVGVISNYEGKVFDDPTHFECHVGALKAAVTLRAQLCAGPPRGRAGGLAAALARGAAAAGDLAAAAAPRRAAAARVPPSTAAAGARAGAELNRSPR